MFHKLILHVCFGSVHQKMHDCFGYCVTDILTYNIKIGTDELFDELCFKLFFLIHWRCCTNRSWHCQCNRTSWNTLKRVFIRKFLFGCLLLCWCLLLLTLSLWLKRLNSRTLWLLWTWTSWWLWRWSVSLLWLRRISTKVATKEPTVSFLTLLLIVLLRLRRFRLRLWWLLWSLRLRWRSSTWIISLRSCLLLLLLLLMICSHGFKELTNSTTTTNKIFMICVNIC
mmetsp:Transcript_22753/g.29050  ORF Transcript_22753/g.29050 Transcript_22753/m.29050 type:complete len:226 (-) Transcript_22753:1493-2170(-)